MQFIRRLLEAEPALTIGVVSAGLALLVTFGVHLGNDQIDAIKNFVTAVLAFAGALAGVRQSVFAPDTHAAEVTAAVQAVLAPSPLADEAP